MSQYSEDETQLRRYLLGELTHQERSQVEERLFLEGDYFQELQVVKDDLVDDYVYEELSVTEREKFETFFLSEPAHREDLKIAQALRKYLSSESEVSAPASFSNPVGPVQPHTDSNVISHWSFRNIGTIGRLTLSAAALVILSICIWLIIKAVRNQDQSRPIQAQQPTPQGTVQTTRQHEEAINSQPDKSPPIKQEQRAAREGDDTGAEERRVTGKTGRAVGPTRDSAPQGAEPLRRTVAFLLIPGTGVRGGGEINKVTLSRDDYLVYLRLPLIKNDYREYRVSLLTDGKLIRTWTGLKPLVGEAGDFVSVRSPAELLRQTNYQIKLSGVIAGGETRDIASYVFQVERK